MSLRNAYSPMGISLRETGSNVTMGGFTIRYCSRAGRSARLCHGCGGQLEQVQFLLGHASVQTTERYIGSKQNLREAVNDRFGISVASDAA